MRPYPEEVIKAIQAGIGAHFAPELKSNYAQAQFAFSMLLFMVVQRDYDTAVPDLVEANKDLRDLLTEASSTLADVHTAPATSAKAALAALPEAAPSLRLSDLRRENEALKAVAATLTPVIEPAADDATIAAMRPVRERMYAWFSADARRRIFPILSA
jgi:hypothetical protein